MTNEQREKLMSVQYMDSVRNFDVETLEIAGLHSVLESLHLPFGGETKSESQFDVEIKRWGDGDKNITINYGGYATPSEKDIKLLHTLTKNGDEHAKVIRGIMIYAKITAPRFWWSEMDTYRIGTDRLASNSTMHQECKALPTEELVKAKEGISESLMQTRVQVFSYQTLRRIYFQRRNHRLPHWWLFCEWIENLPFAEEWITFEK